MTVFKYFLVFLSISLFSNNLVAKETSYNCKPKSAAAIRSNGIQVFKITGKEKPVQITIKDGEGIYSGYFMVNKSKDEILNCFFRIFLILEISKAPNLSIFGLFLKSIIVDSIPRLHFPPSKIYLILLPKSSLMSEAFTALNFEDIFALGAATG